MASLVELKDEKSPGDIRPKLLSSCSFDMFVLDDQTLSTKWSLHITGRR